MRVRSNLSIALVLVGFLAAPSLAHAIPLRSGTCAKRVSSERCSETLERTFERGFFDERVYSPLACNTNVLTLVRRLARRHFNLSRFNVLYIGSVEMFEGRYLSSGRQIHGLNSRDGEIDWNFHVVLETNGYILDLDYSNEPEIVPATEYFRAMFSTESNTQIGIRTIPAAEYARDYSDSMRRGMDEIRNWAYYLYDTDGRYPARLIGEFL